WRAETSRSAWAAKRRSQAGWRPAVTGPRWKAWTLPALPPVRMRTRIMSRLWLLEDVLVAADDVAVHRLVEPGPVDARGNDGDVVRPAALVGEVDQLGAECVGVVDARGGLGELVLPHGAGEAVGAEDDDVAAAQLLVGQVHAHGGLRAERLEDHVALHAPLGLLLGERAGFHQRLDEGLVARELRDAAAAHEVGARVADLREVEEAVEQACGGGGRPHAVVLRIGLRLRVDARVGRLDGLAEPQRELLRRVVA